MTTEIPEYIKKLANDPRTTQLLGIAYLYPCSVVGTGIDFYFSRGLNSVEGARSLLNQTIQLVPQELRPQFVPVKEDIESILKKIAVADTREEKDAIVWRCRDYLIYIRQIMKKHEQLAKGSSLN